VIDPKILAARIKTKNLMRQVTDDSSNSVAVPDATTIEDWAQFKGEDVAMPIMEPMPPRFIYNLTGSGSAMTVMQQLQSNLDVSLVVGYPTPVKQLCEELRMTPKESVLDVIYRNRYSSADAIRMGAEFDMITACEGDWDVILRRKFFTPYQLYHLGFTFTRMLLAGMDLELFS
jgi:hypothetical protein